MHTNPLRPLLSTLAFAGLVASGLAHADMQPTWKKNEQGKIADALRIEVNEPGCPTLRYKVGSPTGRWVTAQYVDRRPAEERVQGGDNYRICELSDLDAARIELPEELHKLNYPGEDVSFMELTVQEPPVVANGLTMVKVVQRPGIWVVKPDANAWIEAQEFTLAHAMDISAVEHVCLAAPTPQQDCPHQPIVLAALKAYLKAVDAVHAAAMARIPDLSYGSPTGAPDTTQMWFSLENKLMGPSGPYAELSDLSDVIHLDSYRFERSNNRSRVSPSTIRRKVPKELKALTAAWAKFKGSLHGKPLLVRVRNADGTETNAGAGEGC